jgi:hypothetical protein
MVPDVRHSILVVLLRTADPLRRSEAANIDKMMHVLDYDRALGDLLELDDTIRASMAREYLTWFASLNTTLTDHQT